ncbi:MAG: transposase [Rhodospirillales bacterium]|nr:transposase [Rhodospirillales bacterium]
MKRAAYLCRLRKLLCAYGSDNIIYFDESGFEEDVRRDAGWAERGIKIYGDVRGGKNTRTNLIMAQRRKKQTMACADLVRRFVRRHNRLVVDQEHLLRTLTKPSVIVMDNAPFHPKAKIKAMLEEKGHKLLCLPKYSPDLNPIENTFGAIKTNWKNAEQKTTLDALVTCKC